MVSEKKNTIYVLHPTGLKNYYRALYERDKNCGDLHIKFREFSILRLLAKGILRLKPSLVLKQIKNILFILSLVLPVKKRIIVGIRPYDWRIMVFHSLLKRHKYYFHTSSIKWDYQIYSNRTHFLTPYLKKKWCDFIENSEGIFCATQESGRQLQKRFKASRISVVKHSIPASYCTNDFNVNRKKKICCLFVGRLIEEKGIHLIYEIVKKLDPSAFEFTFVGAGNLDSEVELFCEGNSNCHFLGYQKNPVLRSIYDKHDFLLVPSIRKNPWEELFGLVIIEGLSRGVIPYVTNHVGPTEILKNDFPNHIFSEKNYIERVIAELNRLSTDKSKIFELRKRAFKLGQQYEPAVIFRRWNELLQIEK